MISLTPSRSGTHTLTSTRSGAPSLVPPATNHLQDLLGGSYLHGGPGFDAAMDAAQNDIQPRVQGAFNSGNRLNSGLAKTAMSQELADAFAKLYGNERSLQSNAALALSPVTQTRDQPMYENELANLLGLASTGVGLADGIFGSGATGDFLQSLFGGGGDDGGIPSVPGASSLYDYFAGGSGAVNATGSSPGVGVLQSSANPPPGLSPDLVSSLTNLGTGGIFPPGLVSSLPALGGFSGGLSGGAGALSSLAGSSPLAGTLTPELIASLNALGTTGGAAGAGGAGFAPAFGSTAPAASGGLLSGGLGTALGAAGPLALAGFGAMSVRNSQAAQKAYLAPVLDNLYANQGKTVTMGGVTGTPFQTPDGKTYLASPSAADPSTMGNGRALYGVYDPSTGQYGALSMDGFLASPQASAVSQNTFQSGSVSREDILKIAEQERDKEIAAGNYVGD